VNISLQFKLNIESDWPPVGSESVPFEKLKNGFRCLSAPLFVYDLSVGDIIEITESQEEFVYSWSHLRRSKHTTVWLLRLFDNPPIEMCLQSLRTLQCNTTSLEEFGCYAIDVPPDLSIFDVDRVLDQLSSDLVAIAFPSMRHPD
jgi:Domain of unknown function (DUF4265)